MKLGDGAGPTIIARDSVRSPIIMTSAIFVTTSHLRTPEVYFDKPRWSIIGVLHNEEKQRMEATILMACGFRQAVAQNDRDRLTFATKGTNFDNGKLIFLFEVDIFFYIDFVQYRHWQISSENFKDVFVRRFAEEGRQQ